MEWTRSRFTICRDIPLALARAHCGRTSGSSLLKPINPYSIGSMRATPTNDTPNCRKFITEFACIPSTTLQAFAACRNCMQYHINLVKGNTSLLWSNAISCYPWSALLPDDRVLMLWTTNYSQFTTLYHKFITKSLGAPRGGGEDMAILSVFRSNLKLTTKSTRNK